MDSRSAIISEIVSAMRRFAELASGPKPQRKIHDGRIRNVRKFLAHEFGGNLLFAPLDFISTQSEAWSTYQVSLSDAAKGVLQGFTVVNSASDPERFKELHSRFLAYCDAHNVAPSSHSLEHQYWLVE